MNLIFFLLVAIAFFSACYQEIWLHVPLMEKLTDELIKASGDAVTLSISLIGTMTFFLGLMKIAEEGGLLKIIAKCLRPLLVLLFKNVPAHHPAMGAIVMNLSANVLGLANAATPFGIKAMQELDKLNPRKGTATSAMILFLAINTSSVTLLPTGVIALRSAAGSLNPAAILPTTLFATFFSTVIAIVSFKICERFFQKEEMAHSTETVAEEPSYPLWVSFSVLAAIVALIPLCVIHGQIISSWVIPVLVFGFLSFGMIKKVPIYTVFTEGAKEGAQVAFKIIPYLVAILSAIALLRASGALSSFVQFISHFTAPLGLPAEAVPMAILRPLSGSGAYAYLASVLHDPTLGPDSYVGLLVSTIQGSTETTFYVLAVYFGAVQIKNFRYALIPALAADLAGLIGAVWIVNHLYR